MRIFIFFLLLTGLLPAEEITRPAWNWYGGWQAVGTSARITHTPGTWPKLLRGVPLKTDTLYRCRFQYLAPEGGLYCRGGKHSIKLSAQKKFAPAELFFKTNDRGMAELCWYTGGNIPVHAEVKEVSVEEFDAKANAVKLDFNNDPGTLPVAFFRHMRWERDGSDKLGTLTIVPANDHIDGGKAMRLKCLTTHPPERLNATSLPVPIISGGRYRIGGWFKSDRDGKAQIIADSGWEKGLTHWISIHNFTVSPEWQYRSFEVDVPKAEKIIQLKSGVLTLSVGLFCGGSSELDVKDITWEFIQ